MEQSSIEESQVDLTKKSFHRLAIASGGTGGHFYPGLSVAREFRKEYGDVIMLLGGKHAKEQAVIAETHGIETYIVHSAPRPRSLREIFSFLCSLISGVSEARTVLGRFKPDALLGMGSFASFTAAVAAKTKGIPIFLHEGNAKIGIANRFLSRWAKYLAISFPPVNSVACKCPIACTGMPVRPELLGDHMTKERAVELINSRHHSDLRCDIPTLLIFGGSQGASVFNETIPDVAGRLKNKDLQIIHLCGGGDPEKVDKNYDASGIKHLVLGGVDYIGVLYSACDAVICRAGASSIAEISLFDRYSFLVPYPYASEQHQKDNAAILEAAGAATVIDNSDFTVENTTALLDEWLENPTEYHERATNCRYIARPASTQELLRLINECLVYGTRVSY
ncbi:MAG: UDP-N-acetylglucosamine--N-acetylmuramyl-(pentapeptide) pyrophosphoryl-undecaprenol N-acetylglucosamine transferase [Victivallales bacterium]|nr:UDP-N-acetylglucosamine--N-acetylmuramyl-(pentapeptide) pyrophosphoryl-undecaprenol N-acetylglucosamine transferase [Victivallales bacterium]